MRPTTAAAIVLLNLGVGSAPASPRVSRDQPGGLGSAIALEYSVRHDVMRPGESVTLLVCLSNQNPVSRRDVEQGDSFEFEFASGALGDCGSISVISPGGELQPTDFACDVDGQLLRLTRVGTATRWPPLDALCVGVAFAVPATSTRAATSMSVGNVGAFRAPSPAALLLSVGDDLGSVGPQGETGAAGPAGPMGLTGASGVGASTMAVSTGVAIATQNQPPEPVPGLDVTLTVVAGARLDVLVDASAYRCPGLGSQHSPVLLLEVDGRTVAEQTATDSAAADTDVRDELLTIGWLSDPLAAGAHRVRVLLDVDEPFPGDRENSRCVGSASGLRHQARLIVKEIRSAP